MNELCLTVYIYTLCLKKFPLGIRLLLLSYVNRYLYNFWQTYITTRNVLDCGQSNHSSRIIFSQTFTLEPNTNWIGEPLPRYGHSKFYKTADGSDFGFGPTGNKNLENPT